MLKRIIPAFKFLFTGKIFGMPADLCERCPRVTLAVTKQCSQLLEDKKYEELHRILQTQITDINWAFPPEVL